MIARTDELTVEYLITQVEFLLLTSEISIYWPDECG